MIKVMGLTLRDEFNPQGDIEIRYTGLRPAEKLYEELLTGTDVVGTQHPRIMRANEGVMEFGKLEILLEELRASSLVLDREGVRQVLIRSINGYEPKTASKISSGWHKIVPCQTRKPARSLMPLPAWAERLLSPSKIDLIGLT